MLARESCRPTVYRRRHWRRQLWGIGANVPRLPAIYFYASLCSYISMKAISHVNVFRILRTTVIKIGLFFILLKKNEKGMSDSFVTQCSLILC